MEIVERQGALNEVAHHAVEVGLCGMCTRNFRDGTGCCLAFPEGIPTKILIGEVDHTKPVHDDNGYQFVPLAGYKEMFPGFKYPEE